MATRGRPKKIKEPTVEVIETADGKLARRFGTLEEVEVVDSKYDEYGVCISCKGGKEGCLHNNLVQEGQSLICTKCGFKVK